MPTIHTVREAIPFVFGALGSFGTAQAMLICQFDYPHTYDADLDKRTGADHDRIQMWDMDHATRCFNEHTGRGPLGLGDWARKVKKEHVMAFAKDILKADPDVEWTGCRILGSVNMSDGSVVWTIALFAKHPDSDTKVYTGSRAPNVRRERRMVESLDGGLMVYEVEEPCENDS